MMRWVTCACSCLFSGNGCLNTNRSSYSSPVVNPGEFLTYILPGYYTPSAPGPVFNVTRNELDLTPAKISNSSTLSTTTNASTPSPATSSPSSAHYTHGCSTFFLIISIVVTTMVLTYTLQQPWSDLADFGYGADHDECGTSIVIQNVCGIVSLYNKPKTPNLKGCQITVCLTINPKILTMS
jgi:hypothetical protein